MALGLQDKVYLGNLNAKRDWGHAKDYVELMWKILQYEKAEDWVIATGVTTSVRDFVRLSFKEIGVEIDFKGEGENEKGYVSKCTNPEFQLEIGKEVVSVDPKYFRPTEVELLIGDASKARNLLDWEPKYDLEALCSEMVLADIELFKRDQILRNAGFDVKNEFE